MYAAMKFIQVRQLFHHYVVFTKSIIFILGLILSYKLVEKTFLDISITHLADAWQKNEYDLRKAALIVNLQEGTSAVSVVLFVYVAEVHTGRFKMVVFATVVCIIGLLLNYLADVDEDDEQIVLGLFYPALGLITLAQAAQRVTLQAFLDDQLRPMDLDEDQRRRRTKFWWTLVSFVAAIFSQFELLTGLEFGKHAKVLAAVTGGCFLVFLLGTKYYNLVATIENPIKEVGIVVIRAIENRNVEYPRTDPQGLFHNSNGDMQILPRVPWLRWLDKAAIAQGTETGSWSSAEQVYRVKRLFKMLPLWPCFLTLSLVAASGSTFFFEEPSSFVDDEDDVTPFLFLANLVRFTEFVVSESSNYVIRKLRERKHYNQQKMELVRIGIGMSCCVPCCIAAWATATHRRRHHHMSLYWLAPHYVLLGLMGGLSEDGLESFYESQVSESLSSFGPLFREFVMGIGKFMSIPCILIFSMTPFRWLHYDLEDSRLDKYYILLAVLSFGNVVIYCLVGWWYGDDAFLVEDEEMGITAQQSDELLEGVASRSVEGQHISHRSLSHRSVSKPKESGCGDATAESSGSGEEAETETPEDPLLGSSLQSTGNISMYNYVLLRAVTAFSRLSSRAARRRSQSKNE